MKVFVRTNFLLHFNICPSWHKNVDTTSSDQDTSSLPHFQLCVDSSATGLSRLFSFLELLPAAQAVGEPDLTSFHHFFPKDNYCSNLGLFSVSNGGCISVMESLFCQYVFLSFLNLLYKFAELFFWQEELIVRLPKPTQQKSQLVLAYNCKASRNSFSNNPLQGSKKYLKYLFVKYFKLFVIDQINPLLFHQMIGPRSYKYCAILTFLFSLSKHLLLCPDMV